jgi:hypothetical protein
MKDNIVVKTIASLVAIIIMGVIIFFIYEYYDSESKKSNSGESDEEEIVVDNNYTDKNKRTYELISFDKKKTIVIVDNSKVYIDYELTDGGAVLTINDEAVSYVPVESEIKYIVTGSNIILYINNYEYVSDDDYSDIVVIADKNGETLKEYLPVSLYGYKYIISNPLIEDKVDEAIVLDNNKLYVTYINSEKDNIYRNEDIIQFTYEFDLNDSNFLDKEVITYKYKYSDYQK